MARSKNRSEFENEDTEPLPPELAAFAKDPNEAKRVIERAAKPKKKKKRPSKPLGSLIWLSGAIPGLLSSLGLLLMILWTPGLSVLYSTIWILIIVVIIQGNTTGINLMKGNIVQVGFDLEDAARVAGAGWVRTYFKIWLPLLSPYLALIGLLNFNVAAGTTASIILLASRETITVSILILEWLLPGTGLREGAAVAQIILGGITLLTALAARHFGLKLGVHHR